LQAIENVRKVNPNFAKVIEKLINHNVKERASLDDLQVLVSLKSIGKIFF
jgi:hypothetical protein